MYSTMCNIRVTCFISATWMILIWFYYTTYDTTKPAAPVPRKLLPWRYEEGSGDEPIRKPHPEFPTANRDILPPSRTGHDAGNSQEISSLHTTGNERNSESNPDFQVDKSIRKVSVPSPLQTDFRNEILQLTGNSSNGICSPISRVRLLRSTCEAKYGKIPSNAVARIGRRPTNIEVDERHKIVACLPPKSGSTTWKTILANNSFPEPFELKDVMQIHDLVFEDKIPGCINFHHLTPEKKGEVLNSKEYFRFMVARHPFERIYSAYKDKLVVGSTPKKKVNYGRQILKMFRKNITKEQWKTGDGVTFREFVRFLNIRRPKDSHFVPIEDNCFPCLINYDYIMKTETMEGENEYIIDRFLGPTKRGIGTVKHVVTNKPGTKDLSMFSLKGRLLEAYKTLTAKDIKFLAKWFKADFLHFGYDWRMENSGEKPVVYSSCTKGGQGEGIDVCC